jgi:hypothetical protein
MVNWAVDTPESEKRRWEVLANFGALLDLFGEIETVRELPLLAVDTLLKPLKAHDVDLRELFQGEFWMLWWVNCGAEMRCWWNLPMVFTLCL